MAVALDHAGAGVETPALDPGPQVGGDAQLDGGAVAGGDDLAVPVAFVLPVGLDAGVVEHRIAGHGQVDRPAHAPDRAQQAVLGVVVGRRAAVGLGALGEVVPGTHAQGVADDEPAGAGLPGRLDHQAARQVAAGRGHHLVVGADAERPGAAVEQGAEDGRRVGPGHAHPLDRPARGDQAGGLAVREEGVVGDRRERAAAPSRPSWRRPRTPRWWRRAAVVRWPSRSASYFWAPTRLRDGALRRPLPVRRRRTHPRSPLSARRHRGCEHAVWDCEVRATSRPASSRTSVSTTISVRPLVQHPRHRLDGALPDRPQEPGDGVASVVVPAPSGRWKACGHGRRRCRRGPSGRPRA